MAAPVLTQWKTLLELLYDPNAPKAPLPQKTLRALARTAAFPEALEEYHPCGRVSCADVLQLCRPVLDGLTPEPEGGWLLWFYGYLSHRLFPDPNRPADTRAQQQAAWFYCAVLDRLLLQERTRCPYDPLTDIPLLTHEELRTSRVQEEYGRFLDAVRSSCFPLLMRIGREVMPFDPASHTIGVHHVALTTARQAAAAGLPVDVALVSAAALSHDTGKFGCRGADARRIPYLHYYFTYQWLAEHNCPTIAHTAANHSTWDLEFENLPLESLILIYADFRVRGTRENGKEVVRIYSLADSYDMIFSKLADMTEAKQRRYRTVYCKLRDFEEFLHTRGIDPDAPALQPAPPWKDAALRSLPETVDALRDLTFTNNVTLMHTITVDASFEQLLESARSEKSLNRIRTYLHLFTEYHTYMTGANKRRVLSFLYELLMHQQGDVRRRAAKLMGRILANSGPRYRKELPANAPHEAMAPTLLAFLTESVDLWESYLEDCLHPDHKISAKHAIRISNSVKIIAENLFAYCTAEEAPHYLQPILDRLWDAQRDDRFILMDTLCHIPVSLLTEDQVLRSIDAVGRMLNGGEQRLAIAGLLAMEHLLASGVAAAPLHIQQTLHAVGDSDDSAVRYLVSRLWTAMGHPRSLSLTVPVSQLYLANLKNAVHWSVKITHIDLLCDDARLDPSSAFHTATHLSNLLSVSEHLPVRMKAGQGLVEISDLLTTDQRNEIVVDLLRELETGQEEISRYIPKYLGTLLCRLPMKEVEEGLAFLEDFVRASSVSPARAALLTLGVILCELARSGRDGDPLVTRVIGLLLTGVAHYDNTIHQTALSVLCKDVLGEDSLPLPVRQSYFLQIGKKLLTLLCEPRDDQLTFFTRAATLNHLYRFLIQCQVDLGDFPYPPLRPVAFFPGTFDPFSTGHKRIVEEIHALGFDVYLAIDEFSWSKRTLPKLQRRQIASMSTADQLDVYVFPDDVPVNIAMAADLAHLRSLFPQQELYLVAGSDVIRNASAYRSTEPGSAAEYNHVIFCRDEDEATPRDGKPISDIIRGKLTLLSLPAYYETVSSTRIREYVDKNMDISMLVDPMVQNYIYENGLYLRAPQFKNVLAPQELYFRWQRGIPEELKDRCPALSADEERFTVEMLSRTTGRLRGWATGHTVRASALYDALGTLEDADYVRQHTSGRVLMVDAVQDVSHNREVCRAMINELLVRSLLDDHTYALFRSADSSDPLYDLLPELGFQPVPGSSHTLVVDMRMPLALIQDVFLWIKEPHHDDPAVRAAVLATRPRMRRALAGLFPGRLVLTFDAELLNQAVLMKVQACNGVLDVPAGQRRLGPYMCVPYGKILSGEIVPNTVTKTLHVDKVYSPSLRHFDIVQYPGYSNLHNQARTIKSFRRPVLLVDDLLHKGYRMEKLDPIFKEEDVAIDRIIVGLMSGRGKDLMQLQHRQVECEYFIPNLSYWFTESQLYPFLGGDSTAGQRQTEGMLSSINLILPYEFPEYIRGASERGLRVLSMTALENARDILLALEERHQAVFSTSLTLTRLAEALHRPRLPDKGRHLQYNLGMPASSYVEDDIATLRRICKEADFQ